MSDHEQQPENHDDHDHDHEHDHGRIYIQVFIGLLICTGISAGIGWMISEGMFEGKELLGWGIMLSVSSVKALLVISFFMHLKWEKGMWKWVLTIPASIMSLFLMVMLVPDIGRRTHYYTDERLDRAAYEIVEPAVPVTGLKDSTPDEDHVESATH
jgi:cytochrome c oxidase subunit 4